MWDKRFSGTANMLKMVAAIRVQDLTEQRGNVHHSKEKGNTGANIQIGTLCIYKKLECSQFMFAEVLMAI